MTFSLAYVLTLLGEIWFRSLLGLKGLNKTSKRFKVLGESGILTLSLTLKWKLHIENNQANLGAVHMIPEWVSFRNEFRSRMKFVLHSHDIIDRPSHLENDRFIHHLENDTHAPLAPHYADCVFITERSSFSVYMIPEWNVIPEREFHSDWKPEWTHSGMTCAEPNFRLGIM